MYYIYIFIGVHNNTVSKFQQNYWKYFKMFFHKFWVSLSLNWGLEEIFHLVSWCLSVSLLGIFLGLNTFSLMHFQSYDAYDTLLCLDIGKCQLQWGNSPGSSAFRGQHSPEALQGTGPRQNAQFNTDWLKTNISDPTPTSPLTKKNLCFF